MRQAKYSIQYKIYLLKRKENNAKNIEEITFKSCGTEEKNSAWGGLMGDEDILVKVSNSFILLVNDVTDQNKLLLLFLFSQ